MYKKTLLLAIVCCLACGSSVLLAGGKWCGGTDTKKCCEEQDLKGKCSCVCVPGNCNCGPRLALPGGSHAESAETFDVITLDGGKVVSRKRMNKAELIEATTIKAGARATPPGRSRAPAARKGPQKFRPVRDKAEMLKMLKEASPVPAETRLSLAKSRRPGPGPTTRECIPGACICKGYADCNLLISVCSEHDYEWNCSEHDEQGGCTGGLCVNKGG